MNENIKFNKEKFKETINQNLYKGKPNTEWINECIEKFALFISERYKDEINFIYSHKAEVFFGFVITFIQRVLLFSIVYVIYRALGFNTLSYFEVLFIQVVVQISIEAFPLPGGSGLSEAMLHNIFIMIFASSLADVGMLLTRTFTFYVPLLVSGIVILLYNVFVNHSKIKKDN